MDKVISFGKGIHRQPSIGGDGELSELVNLIPVDGELKSAPVVQTWNNVRIPISAAYSDESVVFIHTIQGSDNVIYTCTRSGAKKLCYIKNNAEADIMTLGNYKGITAIGNTLVVYDGDRTRYAIWRNGSYVNFDLSSAGFSITIEKEGDAKGIIGLKPYDTTIFPDFKGETADYSVELAPSQLDELYRTADSYINERISKFDYPDQWHKYITFGIAALRVYDGSYIAYTDIFTLDPASETNGLYSCILPFITDGIVSGLADYYQHIQASATKFKITLNSLNIDGEIVTGVDFFLTQPYSFLEHNTSKKVNLTGELFTHKPSDAVHKEMASMVFRKVRSVTKSDLSSNSFSFNISKPSGGEEALNLADIPSFRYSSEKMMVYNGRLNLAGVDAYNIPMRKGETEQKFIEGSITITDPDNIQNFESKGYYGEDINTARVDIVIKVELDDPNFGRTVNWCYKNDVLYPFPPVLSYPSRNATNMTIYMKFGSSYTKLSVPLFHMENGNISFFIWVGGNPDDNKGVGYISHIVNNRYWSSSTNTEYNEALAKCSSSHILAGSADNLLKYSNYGNPFVIPSINSIQVGTEQILGISTAAKALSQGQFGQFPLYVFCKDGIFALEVGSDGSYVSTQVISRDVCNNPNSITQIDGAVVFTTEKGLMIVEGSAVRLLSGHMNGNRRDANNTLKFGFFGEKYADYSAYDNLIVEENVDFRELLSECKISYDYIHRMLHIHTDARTEYVYMLDSGEFAKCTHFAGTINVIPHYPYSIIQYNEVLYRYGDATIPMNGLLLTRKIDMGEPFAMKKLQDMRVYCTKHGDDSMYKVLILVSNDGEKWAVLPSLRQRSFKYYRIAIITKFVSSDRLSGMVMRYDLERTNKLR